MPLEAPASIPTITILNASEYSGEMIGMPFSILILAALIVHSSTGTPSVPKDAPLLLQQYMYALLPQISYIFPMHGSSMNTHWLQRLY